MNVNQCKKTVWRYYKTHKRELPWRNISDPYKVLVSEIMLQQTQVARVYKKYGSFLSKFPTVESLARAPLSSILKEWQGLGYNRRAVNLKKTALKIVSDYEGFFPTTREELLELPGIGQSTAGALLAFAFQKPSVFIETNIRSVFIHFFFKGSKKIHDEKILPLIEKALVKEKNVREWYYALMDYGVMLKSQGNPSRKSAHHTKQSTFKGSHRQKRSFILKHFLRAGSQTKEELVQALHLTKGEVQTILKNYIEEGVLKQENNKYTISD